MARKKLKKKSRKLFAAGEPTLTLKSSVLECISGELAGATFVLTPGSEVIIGRSAAKSNIVISEDKKISRQHCVVKYTGIKISVKDTSSNGIKIDNGSRIAPETEITVNDGSVIWLSEKTGFLVRYNV